MKSEVFLIYILVSIMATFTNSTAANESSIEICSQHQLTCSREANNQVRLIEFLVVRKRDQFRDGSTKDLVVREQRIVLKKNCDLGEEFNKIRDQEWIDDKGQMNEMLLTKTKMGKVVNFANRVRLEILAFRLEYDDVNKLAHSLQIMAAQGWVIGGIVLKEPLTREFTCPDGAKYVDEALVQLVLNKNKKVDVQILIQRRNTTTDIVSSAKRVLLTSEDLNAFFDLLFITEDGKWLQENFPTLVGEITPILIDKDGKKINFTSSKTNEHRMCVQARQMVQDKTVTEIARSIVQNKAERMIEAPKKKKRKAVEMNGNKSADHPPTTTGKKATDKKRKRNIIRDSDDEEEEDELVKKTAESEDYFEDGQEWPKELY